MSKPAKTKLATSIPNRDYLSTGSTLLNLGCSGRTAGGLAKGMMYLYVGDTSSGKTWMGFSALAEASINPEFDDYDLLEHSAENGAHMNVRRFFGRKLERRLAPLIGTRDKPDYSIVQEDFFDAAIERMKEKPCVLLLDSMDALRPLAQILLEKKQAASRKKAKKTGKEDNGPNSYGMEKAKVNTAKMRELNDELRKSKSIFIIIAQAKQRVGFGAKFDPNATFVHVAANEAFGIVYNEATKA